MKTHKGLSVPIVLGVVVVAVAAVIFVSINNQTTPDVVVDQVKEAASQKVEDAKDAAMEKGSELAAEGVGKAADAAKGKANEVMEDAVDEGKTMVGGAVKNAGERIMEGGEEKAGSFEQYSAEKVAANDGAVLFFHAGWCPTCKALEGDLNARASDIPAGVTILKTDFDTELNLRKKYGVTLQHTLVQVDASGNEIKTWRGGNTLESIVKNVQ